MKDNYTYPAIIDVSDPSLVYIDFPDFEYLSTETNRSSDYIKEAQECLALGLIDCEESGTAAPKPTSASKIVLEDHQILVYINVWMPYHRTRQKIVYTKKTLTIPLWLDMLAKQNNINFSEILVDGLKKRLGLNN